MMGEQTEGGKYVFFMALKSQVYQSNQKMELITKKRKYEPEKATAYEWGNKFWITWRLEESLEKQITSKAATERITEMETAWEIHV